VHTHLDVTLDHALRTGPSPVQYLIVVVNQLIKKLVIVLFFFWFETIPFYEKRLTIKLWEGFCVTATARTLIKKAVHADWPCVQQICRQTPTSRITTFVARIPVHMHFLVDHGGNCIASARPAIRDSLPPPGLSPG